MSSTSPTSGYGGIFDVSPHGGSVSPRQPVTPKNVSFELLFQGAQYRARLPMRVQIYPHDTTDSIVTTVKNFYGLYSGPTGSKGVSFEDDQGITLIARYENFRDNMVVYVRVFEEAPVEAAPYAPPTHQISPGAGVGTYMAHDAYPAQQRPSREISRPVSRSSRRHSQSPINTQRDRSDIPSAAPQKNRSRSTKSVNPDGYSDNDYSSDEGAMSTTSGRNKEQLGNTDISVENIVEGGRRKRAKFESSELPLFAPPQMPAATSNPSVSPVRRIEHHRHALSYSGQTPFQNPRPIQASHNYNQGLAHANMYATPSGHRNSISAGMGVLPTPDPTVGSCMSEEDKDVAIQLMRLGDMSNISHGRTSASTLDDTFSGKAEVASSTGATSESEDDSDVDDHAPPARRQKLDASGASKSIWPTTEARFMPPDAADISTDDAEYNTSADSSLLIDTKMKAPKPKLSKPKGSTKPKVDKASRPANASKTKKLPPIPGVPMSPMSAPPSRKPSIASVSNMQQAGDDEQPDLSTKPRCQRCRKSKKGCDRQRPCGRCRDAGLSADQCISEDEGNGRKGRYGRHMGVPISKDEASSIAAPQNALLPAAPIAATPISTADKAKKRKR